MPEQEMPDYLSALTEALEVRNEVMTEVEQLMPEAILEEHDAHFGDDLTNKLVTRYVEDEAELRLARRQRDRALGRIS